MSNLASTYQELFLFLTCNKKHPSASVNPVTNQEFIEAKGNSVEVERDAGSLNLGTVTL